MPPRRAWPQFELEPVASLVTPGTILFLNSHQEALQHIADAKLTFGALCHPCIALESDPSQRRVKIIIMTTFGGRRIESVQPSRRMQEYLSIFPTPANPAHPEIQLKFCNGVMPKRQGYVNFEKVYFVPWAMLTLYDAACPIDHFQLEPESLRTLLTLCKGLHGATRGVRSGSDEAPASEDEDLVVISQDAFYSQLKDNFEAADFLVISEEDYDAVPTPARIGSKERPVDLTRDRDNTSFCHRPGAMRCLAQSLNHNFSQGTPRVKEELEEGELEEGEMPQVPSRSRPRPPKRQFIPAALAAVFSSL